MKERLAKQIEFILEIDKMKSIYRQNYIIHGGRNETDAEHSWHMAIMVLLLAEHADVGIDPARAAKMALLHDLVEIDAGDTYCFDQTGLLDKEARELKAAERIFGLLPEDQADEWKELWREFEAGQTPEAAFVNAIDRLQPLLLHSRTEGRSWREHGIAKEQVYNRNEKTREVSSSLGELVTELIEAAVTAGYLR